MKERAGSVPHSTVRARLLVGQLFVAHSQQSKSFQRELCSYHLGTFTATLSVPFDPADVIWLEDTVRSS